MVNMVRPGTRKGSRLSKTNSDKWLQLGTADIRRMAQITKGIEIRFSVSAINMRAEVLPPNV